MKGSSSSADAGALFSGSGSKHLSTNIFKFKFILSFLFYASNLSMNCWAFSLSSWGTSGCIL